MNNTKINTLFLILISVSICFAQKNSKREGTYSANLYSVEAPSGLKLGIIDSTKSKYEDSLITIEWKYATSQIEFDLTNNTSKTIRIIWDDAVFISILNESNRIFHKGVKYTERENPQQPTAIYRSSSLSDLIAPTSYSTFTSGQYGGWTSKPLIPAPQGFWSTSKYDENLIGKTMRVVLPIKIEEKMFEYVFSFKTYFIDKKK